MSLGADYVIDRERGGLRAALQAATGKSRVNVVADVIGGPIWPELLSALTRRGRYVCSGAVAGAIVEFDLRTFYLRDLVLLGATIVPEGTFANLVSYIERREIKPLVAATFRLRQLHAAQDFFLARNHIGNVVVTP